MRIGSAAPAGTVAAKPVSNRVAKNGAAKSGATKSGAIPAASRASRGGRWAAGMEVSGSEDGSGCPTN
ncbi:hypothetical protein GCM10017653_10510 [Ancylobacter defluvii]|uniref:Uncharacterized protein n=1 Tax=Ancylobacter defluvii TaxID=1282440 RepID=A0A9W6JTM3_9HYPH|nr:hypothetical protein GCM10017653_10510 [Ancylobacter defluvii]